MSASSSQAFQVNHNKEDSMGTQQIVLYVVAAVLLVFYMMRRRNRLSREED
jgi:hypothetical protein